MSQSPYHRLFFNERQNFLLTPSTRTKTSWSVVEEVASCELLVASSECILFLRVTLYSLLVTIGCANPVAGSEFMQRLHVTRYSLPVTAGSAGLAGYWWLVET